MAAPRRGTSQVETPTPAPTPDIFNGLFIDSKIRGFVEPSEAEATLIRRLMRDDTRVAQLNSRFWADLHVIKLLAPEQSRELVIYGHDTAQNSIHRIAQQLMLRYYRLYQQRGRE